MKLVNSETSVKNAKCTECVAKKQHHSYSEVSVFVVHKLLSYFVV